MKHRTLRFSTVAACSMMMLFHPAATGANAASSATSKTTTKQKPATTQVSAGWRILSIPSNGLEEVSGCIVSRRQKNTVWVHNDADDGPYIVPVNINSAKVGLPVELQGVAEVDPEDISMTGNGEVILADIGDNTERRSSVQLYRFPEPLSNATTTTVQRYELTYPDGPHNAEAFLVDPNSSAAFIVTKASTGAADLFQIDLENRGTQTMVNVGQVRIVGETGTKANMISAADAAADRTGTTVVLRTYQNGYQFRLSKGASLATLGGMMPRRFPLPAMVQGEGLCIAADGRSLVTVSESQGAKTFALAVGRIPS